MHPTKKTAPALTIARKSLSLTERSATSSVPEPSPSPHLKIAGVFVVFIGQNTEK